MTICLAMIVKNEEHCITKCLESVKPYIDYWVICDTGSSDNTKQVILDFMSDVPGELHDHEWFDFSTNRNKVIKLAHSHADYILIIDADDLLYVEQKEIFDNLKASAYNIKIVHETIVYNRIQLFKSNIQAEFKGVLHEYLDCDFEPKQLHGCHIIFGAIGSRSLDPNKYIKDALLLEKAMQDEPANSRYVFYAAQSYRDAARPARALDLYFKRCTMGGWIEEEYISLLESAKIMDMLFPNDIMQIEEVYLAAFNKQPQRVESLTYLSAACRKRAMYHKAYFYASVGFKISIPDSGLFLELGCYNWKIMDELAISAYYIGKKKEAKLINIALLESNLLPKEQISRIKNNLNF